MSILHTKGLSFRKKRKKVNISSAKNAALWALEIIVVLVVAFMIVYFAGMKVTVVGNSMEQTLR
ncbi:MAG: hypothetical protein V8R80_03870 [Eubacterium sp.]